MKRIFHSFLMFMTCLAVSAADTLSISYCAGELATASTFGCDGKGQVSAAIFAPASTVGKFEGNAISAVKAGLTTRLNIDSMKVWIRTSLDGEDIASGMVRAGGTPKLLKGWNIVDLDTPLPVTGQTGDLYIGYTYYARSRAYAVSVVGDRQKGTSFVNVDGTWKDVGDAGVLSIEGVVVGDNLPSYDLSLSHVAIGPDPAAAGAYYADLTVTNHAARTVSGFDVEVKRGETLLSAFSIEQTIGNGEQAKIHTSFVPEQAIDPSDIIEFTITSIVEGADAFTGNNTCPASFIFERNVLVEEFTTERCSNCPRVAGYLHSALAMSPDYATRVVAVCHHAGFYTDWLTQDCDEDLLDLYTGSVYAPAVAVNRMPYFANRDGGDDNVFTPGSAKVMATLFDSEMERGADCYMTITPQLNADETEVTLTIAGQKNLSFETEGRLLTVYVLENNIEAQGQAGATGKYVQDHVIRAYNSSWGDAINWDGNAFTASYTFKINKGDSKAEKPRDVDPWKLDDLQFVAIIANHTPGDKLKNQVENVVACTLENSAPTGIEAVGGDGTSVEVARYDASGRRLQAPAKGINIVRYSDGTVRKHYIR